MGLLAQLHAPEPKIAGMQQAALVTPALLIGSATENGFCIVDVFEYEEAVGRFSEAIRPIAQVAGIEDSPEVLPRTHVCFGCFVHATSAEGRRRDEAPASGGVNIWAEQKEWRTGATGTRQASPSGSRLGRSARRVLPIPAISRDSRTRAKCNRRRQASSRPQTDLRAPTFCWTGVRLERGQWLSDVQIQGNF
jgi:hypothetical protein